MEKSQNNIIWKDVKNYEGLYKVSNTGLVKSLDRIDCAGRSLKGRMFALNSKAGSGYIFVTLSKDGQTKQKYVHQLVAESFLNHTSNGFKIVVDHIDNNKTNNNLSNLQLLTNRQNSSKNTKRKGKYVGVRKTKYNTYRAEIRVNGKKTSLGSFKCETKAHIEYLKRLNEIT